jgi:hypothetical protein
MMRRNVFRSSVGLAALVSAAMFGGAAQAQEASTHPSNLPQARQAEGVPVESVSVRIKSSGGDAAQDDAALAAVRRIATDLEGSPFSIIETMRVTARMEREAAVSRVEYRLLPKGANAVSIQFLVDAAPARKADEGLPKGVLTGELSDFPVLYKDDRSLFTAIVAGGLGVYSDGNAWFGNPDAFAGQSFDPGARTSWTEGSLEVGGGFATQLGESPVYAFGALTGMKTWTLGNDIFRDDDRDFDAVEKAYAGLLYADRASRDYAKLGVGRQTFTLNDGFLVNMVRGSVNAGDRGASYLGPRLTNEFSVLADGRFGSWSFNAFYIDPSELDGRDTRTTYLGTNLKYRFTDNLSLDGTLITIPTSDTLVATADGQTLEREGLNTAGAHLLWKNAGFEGLFLESELAHQWHPDQDVSAWAGYGTIGYIARQSNWTPSISYRYAEFSGDDPDTETFERWDALLSTGLGIWLQGVSFGKIISNSNLATHRVQLNVVPVETLNVTFDYYKLSVPETDDSAANRIKGTLGSHDLGQEFSLSGRWAINRNLYLQGIASYAIPGEALRDIGADENWSSLQLSLYWGL